MELTEQDYYQAFGVTPKEEPAQDTAQEDGQQNTADPQPQEPDTQSSGGGAQDPQPQEAPASDDDDQEDGQEPQAPEGNNPPASGKQELTPEQRKVNAARRRAQEQQQAIDQAVQQARQEEQQKAQEAMEKFFRDSGMRNTITDKPITNLQEFQEFQQAYDLAEAQRQLQAGELTPETLQKLIAQNPVIQQAQAMVQQQNQQAQEQARQREQEQQQIQFELNAIKLIDPTAENLDAILNGPYAQEFKAGVEAGKGFLQSYTEAREAHLTNQKAQAAAQAMQQSARGKSHLHATGSSGGTGPTSVPADKMPMFRAMNPGKSDAEINAWYNKHRKN